MQPNTRETKEVITPVEKHTLVLNTYITGREKRQLQNVYLEGKGIDFNADQKTVTGLRADLVDKATDLAWRIIVVSFDGKKDGVDGFNVVDAILDLRAEDYNFVVATVNDTVTDKDFQEKKTS
jgi:hypothetical protein